MECEICGKVFDTVYLKNRHEQACTVRNQRHLCQKCGEGYSSKKTLIAHMRRCETSVIMRKRARIDVAQGQLYQIETAHGGTLKTFFLPCTEASDAVEFLCSQTETLHRLLRECLEETDAPLKYNLVLEATFENPKGETCDRAFKTKNKVLYEDSSILDCLSESYTKIATEMEESALKGSGWSVKNLDGVLLRVNRFQPLGGCSFIPLPPHIANKKAVINVQNTDDRCFKYAILSRLVEKDPQRVSKYKNLEHSYNFDCISFPTPLHEVKKFEKYNNISVNVFALGEKGNVYPLKVVKQEKEDHRDLLLLTLENGRSHYTYISDFDRLVARQINSHKGGVHVCKRCFQHFNLNREGIAERVKEHMEYCGMNRPSRIVLPECNDDGTPPTVSFTKIQNQLRIPIVIYADFESILKKINNNNPGTSQTTPYQSHLPMSFCTYVKVAEDIPRHCIPADFPAEPYIYTGEDAAEKFMAYIKTVAEKVAEVFSMKRPMLPLTPSQLEAFLKSQQCYLCSKPFLSSNRKVADHDHITGVYRGPAHSQCNILYRTPRFLPVFLHNLSGYDAHFIVRELGYDNSRIDVIPNSEEKYISFSKQVGALTVRFVDTFRFMASSLDRLSKNLPRNKFIDTGKFFPADKMDLVTRKGVYPYDYTDSFEKLRETVLPPKEAFYSILNECHISDEDYQHAQSVWEAFGIRTLGGYSELYLKVDVMLLCDIFENFRDVCIGAYSLDPAWYFTAPGLAWDAMLKCTGVQLDLLTDYDQLLMVERGIRGGICQCSHRYSKADNAYLYPDRDPHKESSYIAYLDANNLYGWEMSNPLRYGAFEWVSDPDTLDWGNMQEDGPFGYIVEADIEEKYVVHFVNLRQAMGLGLRLVRVHRALRFRQSRWLSSYIDLNTQMRQQATNDFDKDFYKLMNNAVFGKFMEDVRKRTKIELVTDERRIRKLIAKPTFKDRTIYSETLTAVHLDFEQITMNKPIYVGMAILDLSKVRMYDFHYATMLTKYGPDKLKLLYTDTDSLMYLVKTRDFYKDITTMMDEFDTSDYPDGHPCKSDRNKKVLGKFKDEASGEPVSEFVGLRAKMYAVRIRGLEKKRAKGIKKAARKVSLSPHDDKRHLVDRVHTLAHGHFAIADVPT
ncbi:uncharacterized protein [Rhodnius prolixus]|uniref:uncharacterized protein n=1 Tax=Rhodnius prolixus TaxID=13249 RepID=UPI003D188DD3